MTNAPGSVTRTPGELALHPVALISLAVLLVNDHALKGTAPGWLTGKLSDVAGMVFFPFLVLALYDVVRRRHPPGVRAAAVAAVSTGTVFSAVKLIEPVTTATALVAGYVRAPLDAAVALISGTTAPPVAPAVIVPDPSDVATVVACLAVVLVIRRAPHHERGSGPDRPGRGSPGATSGLGLRTVREP